MKRNLLASAALTLATGGFAQLNVSTALTPEQLVQDILVGTGVQVSNVTFNGFNVVQPQEGTGSFSNGAGTNLGLDAGIVLGSGDVNFAIGPNNLTGGSLGGGDWDSSDPDLDQLSGVLTHDAAILEFDFVPTGDSLKFRYVFGSEEYDEYVCGTVNDAFGFFLSGPGISGPFTNDAINIALIPGTNVPVSINTVNNGTAGGNGQAANCFDLDPNWQSNSQFFVSNNNGVTIQYDGMTVVLTAKAQVQCGQTYHIKLAIADGGDTAFDSGVFLEENSFTSEAVPSLTSATLFGDGIAAEGCLPGTFTVYRPEGTDSLDVTIDHTLTGTATNGADYTGIPDVLTIPAGQDSVVYTLNAMEDGVPEGPETVILAVFIVNACGDTLGDSQTITIQDYQPLEIQTQPLLLLTCDQDSIPLLAAFTGGYGPTTLLWNDSLESPQFWVPGMEDGVYIVSVSDGCPRSTEVTVHVDAGCEVVIPNVITPNGDGHNDKFVVRGILGRENHVQIWDRWGKAVLDARNYRNTFGGNDLHDGTYFYIIRVLEKEYTGHLTVLGSN